MSNLSSIINVSENFKPLAEPIDSSAEIIKMKDISKLIETVDLIVAQKLSSGTRKKLTQLERVFVNGRYFFQLSNSAKTISYWHLERPDFSKPFYYLPGLPHVISHNINNLCAEFDRLQDYFEIFDSISFNDPALAGLTVHDGAYPRGGFANSTEYERYLALYINNRHHEIAAYLAALAGAPVFNPRDPYPHGYCYLHLLPFDKQAKHYREGQEILTKEILDRIIPDIDPKRILAYELRAADAHLTTDKRVAGQQILIRVGDLVEKLKAAFNDGICDLEELADIYYNSPLVHR